MQTQHHHISSRVSEPFLLACGGIVLALVSAGAAGVAQTNSIQSRDKFSPAQTEVRDALAKFIHAFDNLNWEQFRSAFDDNATVFFPGLFTERAEGRAALDRDFKVFFQRIRTASGKKTAPYLDLRPKLLKIQVFNDVAVVTFHLEGRPGLLGRRTIVLLKTSAGWKIVHIHASEIAVPAAHR